MALIQLDSAETPRRARTANVPDTRQRESVYIPPHPCGCWTPNRKNTEY